MLLHQLMDSLKKERERQGLSLEELSTRAGIDKAALSRLETGANGNPTLETLCRIASSLGKAIVCFLQDATAKRPSHR